MYVVRELCYLGNLSIYVYVCMHLHFSFDQLPVHPIYLLNLAYPLFYSLPRHIAGNLCTAITICILNIYSVGVLGVSGLDPLFITPMLGLKKNSIWKNIQKERQ